MGAVYATFGVTNPRHPEREVPLELLVDTGALYSVLPISVLRELAIDPQERKTFKTADGRRIERAVGEAVFAFNGERGTCKVVFGVEEDATVLGVTALETLGLEVDPTSGTLRPATLFLFFAAKASKKAVEVTCPHCQAKLTVDTELAAVLSHEPPPKQEYDFEGQLKELSEAERKREEVFRQQVEAQKERSKLLERKFQESFEKAKDQPVTRPIRDIDLE